MTNPPPARPAFRPDIEGLRALAVLAVMAYHAGWTFLGGGFAGVDVFFVVSGFVITAQLLRELDRDGTISLTRFYGRRAKRLLPAAGVVILVTAAAAWALAPVTQLRTIAGDLIGSSLYVVNWVFASRSVDYLAEDVEPSPMQHYWSLAVEEQFYLIWPVLFLLMIWLARRFGARVTRAGLATGLALLVVVPSLLWAFYLTHADPARAFFVTTTRLWELGVGALIAIGASLWPRIPRVLGSLLAAAGVLTVIAGMLLQSSATPWPGPGALVPVLGTAAVIIGGFSAGASGVSRVLGVAPLIWIGGLSYSLYLWHWAVLRIAQWQFGDLALWQSTLAVLASVLPAWVCYRLIEQPIRHSKSLNASPLLSISVGVNATVVAVVAALLLMLSVQTPGTATSSGGRQVGVEQGEGLPQEPGDDLDGPPLYPALTPDPLQADEDVPDLYSRGCQVDRGSAEPVLCEGGVSDSDVTVALLGDSKIAQWESGFEVMAEEQGWRLISHTKSGCVATDETVFYEEQPDTECREWGRAVMDQLLQDPPDVVIISGRREEAGATLEQTSGDNLAKGYARYWEQLAEAGTQVIAISDTPDPKVGGPSYECVAANPDDYATVCVWDYQANPSSHALRGATELVDGALFVDMDPWICPGGTCRSVYRNIVTYRQGSHITDTFVLYLTPILEREILPVINEHREATR